MSNHKVERNPENPQEFTINFLGPADTLYETGKWMQRVYLPDSYPFKSPSLGFVNKMFHPNVDLKSGTICLDVINQTWSPMYEQNNIFDVFQPQLLSYPNASDPLNIEAANLLLKNESHYKEKVKEYVKKYANGSNFTSLSDINNNSLNSQTNSNTQEIIPLKKSSIDDTLHKISTDIEDSGNEVLEEDQMDDQLSNQSQLSDLSETSGIMDEESL